MKHGPGDPQKEAQSILKASLFLKFFKIGMTWAMFHKSCYDSKPVLEWQLLIG